MNQEGEVRSVAHETMSDDPNELEGIAFALRKRISDAKYRVEMLEAELVLVEKKIAKLKGAEGAK